jgi:RNA polymerase sigma-70 factor (ECF subfamily)
MGSSVLTATHVDHIEHDAASLVARARGGDVSAFESVYGMHAAHVFGVCLQMSGDRGEAEELSQDAWVRAWERLDTFRGEATFGTWMHRLTVNLLLDKRRSDARWRQRLVSMEDEGQAVDRKETAASTPGAGLDLERAVASLPAGARVVFLLHEVDGYKHREIAERLGVAVGTVKAQLHRARKLLQIALER